MARKKGVAGWHGMRKDQLVRALVRLAKSSGTKSRASRKSGTPTKSKPKSRVKKVSGRSTKTAPKMVKAASRHVSRKSVGERATRKDAATVKSPSVVRRIKQVNAERERLKDLSLASYRQRSPGKNGRSNGRQRGNGSIKRDRAVLMVRDSYWLHAHWEICHQTVERVRAAMAEQWHAAQPVLRLIEVEAGATTNTSERVEREIAIHGGVNNWYIDVYAPPKSYRVQVGYLAENGKFHSLARSNAVTTPPPGSSDAVDRNWSDVADDYERVYAMSGGYSDQPSSGDLKELFEERLRRPMGSPLITRYGIGAEGAIDRKSDFAFDVDAELIIFGRTNSDAHVTLAGQPVKLRPDGTFTVRQSMPDRRQVLPVVAGSSNGLEQRTIILAIERNTKVMEPLRREPNE
jgi:hypothetical protein